MLDDTIYLAVDMDACKNQCILFALFSLFAANLHFHLSKVVQKHT